ncbi:acyltransferase [Acetonema longum]|uniref:Acetyltransferase n=1 Tax=Acetonema longum DSM 6540 TaxID=1009370 RepID=F7NNV9_9FIRM|nr:acyltransferase [Acetonema longum]EGO62293.1 acetyltransferase [Acetonema longum DSM 6540]
MAFYSESELKAMGFHYLGANVRISAKASIYQPESMDLYDNCRVDDFCLLSGRIAIGRNVHIAAYCNVAGADEGITFEDFSGLAYHCNVFTRSDDYSGETMTNPTVPAKYKNVKKAAVRIGRHVIVGTGSAIFPGVTVAEGCSVGSLSVVTRSTEPWMIYAGVPAKPIKQRSQKLLELERKYLAEQQG